MANNLSALNLDIPINNSYLKSSYSNRTFPYIKGKKYESIYGHNNRIVAMDSFLNKHYLSQMKKQDLIRQEKIILDIIEKFDNKKAFNMLKEEYLREKLKITKGYYLNKGKKKKDYYTNLVNLENYKEKLITENKSNNSDGDFLFSLMDCLGCRPKKVMVKKINKKIEFLSKYKSFSQRKKQEENITDKKPKKRNSLQILLNLENMNNINNIGRNNNYLNYYNTTFNHKTNNNNNIEQNNLILKLDDNDNKNTNTLFNKTNSTTFGLTHYNNFYHPKENLTNIDGYDNNENYKNGFNNLKIEEIKKDKDNSFQNSLNDSNIVKIDYTVKSNKYINKKTSQKKSIRIDLPIKQNLFKFNSQDKNYTFNKGERNSNSFRNHKKNISYKFKKFKNKFLNTSDVEDNEEEIKMIDLKIINEKLNKKHVKVMKQFLDKVKKEEKYIKENSNKLSNSLYLIKKMNQRNLSEIKNKERNKTQILKRGYNTERNDSKKKKDYKINESKVKIGNYDFLGKSKYRASKVNKIIFGSIENSKDNFEILQLNLLNEVKKQILKKGFSKRLKLNGRDILDRLKIKMQK